MPSVALYGNAPGKQHMGDLIRIASWKRRHARASASRDRAPERRACIDASVSLVTPLTFRTPASRTIAGQRMAGIPRLRQLLTTVRGTESAFATAEVPPNASSSESDVMTEKLSTYCGVVNIHASAIACALAAKHALAMAKPYESIGKRLSQLRTALDVSQAELCREIKCSPTRWNNYELGDRRITLPIAMKLADEYGASLDWIYRGERGGLPLDLRSRLNKAA